MINMFQTFRSEMRHILHEAVSHDSFRVTGDCTLRDPHRKMR